MDEALKQYTAFTVGNLGFFECEHLLLRLCNAPATFQRLKQDCLGELNLTYCLIYLDDVIMLSATCLRLHTIFTTLIQNRLFSTVFITALISK